MACWHAQKSQDCPFLVSKGLKPTSGTVTWEIPDGVPDSTIYLRAYAMCQKDEETTVKCAYGNSPGFIEVRHPAQTLPCQPARCSVRLYAGLNLLHCDLHAGVTVQAAAIHNRCSRKSVCADIWICTPAHWC